MRQLHYIDLFCGAGGVTTGVEQAMIDNQKCARVIACVNHDPHAIASHLANHPECVHFTEDIRTLDVSPIKEIVERIRKNNPQDLIVLWASCECTNYSKAKGGQSRDADSRTLPEHLFRYIKAINPDYIQLENVEEFMSWGDLDENGHPLSKDKGRLYLRWINKVKKYGYQYEYRLLNAADFGAYTSRKRFFGQFAKKGLPISFPEPTHSRKPEPSLFGELKPWKAVKDVLNFEDEGKSIFDREKPLVDATLRRILAGLKKFVTSGDDQFLMKYFSGDDSSKCISIDGPAGTITCKDHHALITTTHFIDQQYGQSLPASVNRPAGTLTTKPKLNLVTVKHFFDKQYGTGVPASVKQPCDTITTVPKQRFVSVYLLNPQYNWPTYTIDRPCPTIIARQDKRPMYALFTLQGEPSPAENPTDSAVMKELKRFCREHGITDIKMRMLRIDELLPIMGFPKDYKLLGTKNENKKYIGNAVECGMARQLCESLYQKINLSA